MPAPPPGFVRPAAAPKPPPGFKRVEAPVDQPGSDLIAADQGGLGDTLFNLGRGVAERVSSLTGGLSTTMGAAAQSLQRRFPSPYITWGDDGLSFMGPEEFARRGGIDVSESLVSAGEASQKRDLGYEPMTGWEDVKAAEGLGDTLLEGLKFGGEQAVVSAPDMVAALANLPLYMAGRTGEVAQERVDVGGRDEITDEDLAIAAGTAGISALMERFGAERVLGKLRGLDKTVLRRIIGAGAAESGTEAGQSGVENVGARLGQADLDLDQILDEMAAGAVGGAVGGAGIRSTAEAAAALAPGLRTQPDVETPDVGQQLGAVERPRPALPSPGPLEVTPEGEVGTRADLDAAQQADRDLATQFGLTPDIVRNLERLEERKEAALAEAAARELPALPPPDTTLQVTPEGVAAPGFELDAAAAADAAAEQELATQFGLTPDVVANLERLEARQAAERAARSIPALPAPDPTVYVDQGGGAGTVAQREDYTRQANQELAAAADEAARLGFTPDVAYAGAVREAPAGDVLGRPATSPQPELAGLGDAIAPPAATPVPEKAPAPPAGFVRPAPQEQLQQPRQEQQALPEPQPAAPRGKSALEFLASKGGLSIAALEAEGIDRADMRSVRGFKRPFTKKGMTLDAAAELLDEAGYPVRNAQGAYDANVVLDVIANELRGRKTYPLGEMAADEGRVDRRRGETREAGERRGPPPRETPDRRIGDRRARVGEMTREELVREVLTSRLTGLPNRRAYDEAERLPVQASLDVDSLKWVNDNMGHESGDKLLELVGQAIKDETDRGYHFSGDEFAIEGATEAEIREIMEAVGERLAKATLEVTKSDGTVVTLDGIGVSYGTGDTLAEADEHLGREKTTREAQGLRARRGEQPAGASIRRRDQEGRPDNEGNAAAQIDEDPLLSETDKRGAWYSDATEEQRAKLDEWEDARVVGASNFENLTLRAARESVNEAAQASFYDYEIVRGVVDVPIQDLDLMPGYNGKRESDRIEALAELITESGEIEPIFVGLDPNGEVYVVEGQHRVRALQRLGYTTAPSRVIVDMDERDDAALAEEQQDLFGDDTRTRQSIADREREKDRKRSPNRDVDADTGMPGDLFTRRQQRDIEDVTKETPPGADAAAREYGFEPDEVGWTAGRGPLGRGKFMASARGQSSNLHATAADAVKELASFVDVAERGKSERDDVARAQAAVADKVRAGTNPTFEEWRKAFPQLRDGHRYLRQPEIAPFLVEHFGFSKARIREPLGKAAGFVRSDSGAKYPIVYFNRLADVLGNEDVADVKPKRAVAEQLSIEYAGQRYPVSSLKDAQAKWDRVREQSEEGVSGMTGPVKIYRGDKQIGTISYNGRLWDMNDKPLLSATPERRRTAREQRPETVEPAHVDTLRQAVEGFFEGAKNAPKVNFVAGAGALPRGIVARLRESPGRTWLGLYDPITNSVWINHERVKDPLQAIWVAAHEIDGHLGLRGFVGKMAPDARKRVNDALEVAGQNMTIDALAQAIRKQRTALTRLQSIEEALAELQGAHATNRYDRIARLYGIETPVTLKGERGKRARSKLRRAIDNFLRRMKAIIERAFGWKATDQQIADLLEGARRYVRQGTPKRDDARTPKRDRPELVEGGGLTNDDVHEKRLPGPEREERIGSARAEPEKSDADVDQMLDDDPALAVADRRQGQRRASVRGGRRSKDKPARSAKGDKGYAAAAQHIIDAFNNKVGWRYGALGKLPSQRTYLKERYQALGRIGKSQAIARLVYNAFRKATPAEARAVYEYLTTRGALASSIRNEKLRNDAIQTKNLIDSVGKRLVAEGLLSQEAYDEHRGEYLPRVYLKHLLGERAVRAIGAGKTTSDMGYLKQRLSEEQLPKEVRDVILGEITDPAFLASFSLGRTLRDLALIDFFKTIAGNERWVPQGATVEWNGRDVSPFWLEHEAKRIRRQAQFYTPQNATKARDVADRMEAAAAKAIEALGEKDLSAYKQIPDSARYGVLRGLWVRQEIYGDLVGQRAAPAGESAAERLLGEGGLLTGLTRAFKISKVVLNPPSQVRNFVSNLMLLQLSGVPARLIPKRVGQAIRSLVRRDRYFEIYERFGGTAATWQASEVRQISDEWIRLKELEKNPLARVMALGASAVNTASNAYGILESVGKIAKLIDAMDREGKSPSDAMLDAHEALFDYSLVPSSVRYLRNNPLGAPFLTFQYKVLPQLARTALKHPLRYAPYVALPYLMLEAFTSAYDVDDDDVEKLRNAFPSWMRERGQMLLLPWKDDLGRWQVMDVGYIVPWGLGADLYATAKEDPGKAAKNALQQVALGGPLTDVAAALETNVDPFTGRQIVNPADPPADRARAMLLYVWNLAMPGFMTERGAIPQTVRAAQGNVNVRGERGQTLGQAMLRMFGINVYPVDPQASRAANIRAMEYEQSEREARAAELLRDRNLTQAQRDEIRATWRKILADGARAIQAYRESSEIHPNLRTKPDDDAAAAD